MKKKFWVKFSALLLFAISLFGFCYDISETVKSRKEAASAILITSDEHETVPDGGNPITAVALLIAALVGGYVLFHKNKAEEAAN